MNRTAALAIATRAVCLWGRGTDWTVSCPWDRKDPYGPGTHIACSSYAQARQCAARARAGIALALLGQYNDETALAIECRTGSTRSLLSDALGLSREYTFRRATYNGERGWIVTRREHGVFIGRAFGRTRAAAVAALA